MKVLHIFNEIRYSGAEIMYADASPLFLDAGIEMVVLSTGNIPGEFAEQFRLKGIEVKHVRLPENTHNLLFLFKYFRYIYQYIVTNKIDVVHVHRATYFWFFAFTSWVARKRSIRTVHSVFKSRKLTWIKAFIERFTARNLFGVVFQTIGESVYLNELYYYRNPSVRINNWYNKERFFPQESEETKRQLRDKLNIPQDVFVIISSGSCTPGKNHHDIVRALQGINKKIKCLYVHLGKGHTETEEKQIAEDLQVSDKIMFLGNRNNVRDYLIASDVFVMPSKFEGLSIASIEAMGCARPSILYDSPGLRDLIKEDDTGFLIKKDYKEIIEKVLWFAEHPESAKTMGQCAYQSASANYSMETGVKKIVSLYKGEIV